MVGRGGQAWEIVSTKSLEMNVGARIPEFSFRTVRSCDFIESTAICVTWDRNVTPATTSYTRTRPTS